MDWVIALLVAFALPAELTFPSPAPDPSSVCRLETVVTKRLDRRTGRMTDSMIQRTVCDRAAVFEQLRKWERAHPEVRGGGF
jgi:hypothetical protein